MAKDNKVRREQYWHRLWLDWKVSGLSLSKFCKEQGVPASSFWSWSKRFASNGSKSHEMPVFLPIKMAPCTVEPAEVNNNDGSIEILVAGKYQVKVAGEFLPTVLDRVITVLEGRVC